MLGVALTALWTVGVSRGVMPGPGIYWPGKWIARRESSPVVFWVQAAVTGSIAFAILVVPVLSWVGLRG